MSFNTMLAVISKIFYINDKNDIKAVKKKNGPWSRWIICIELVSAFGDQPNAILQNSNRELQLKQTVIFRWFDYVFMDTR